MRHLLSQLQRHAEERPDAICVELVSKRRGSGRLTFREVHQAAARAAGHYRAQGVSRGDIVVMIGTHHLDFYASWLGAVWLGAIPSVLAEPSVRIDREIYTDRLRALLDRVSAKALAVDPTIEIQNPTKIPTLSYDAIAREGSPVPMHEPSPEDLMLLQHSSGTTGLQKGVMLSHGAIARHAEVYASAIEASPRDVVASWLPLYHDMGLIACFVTPLFVGMKVVWLSPFEWVATPSILLEAIAAHRATLAWLPNFAYPFLAQRTRNTYDLSSLRAVINCSEPVSEEAMQAFLQRFEKDGFTKDALHACYALAENVFAVTTSRRETPRRVLSLDRKRWLEDHVAADGADLTLVSNGTCLEGCEVMIAEDGPLPPRHAGRVLVRSPFLFDGYFRRDDLNAGLLQDGWFDTGDVGFLDELGHLYVTGRKKDLIIVGGRNLYPQDVEQAAAETAGVYAGRVVCFGVPVVKLGTEAVVVLAESESDEAEWPAVARGIKKSAAAKLDLDVLDARIVPRMSLRKSTSGKLARAGNRDWYLEGKFGPLPPTLER